MKIKRIAIGLLALSVMVFGGDSKFSFSLKGGYYLPSSSSYNNDYVPMVNNNINELNSYLTSLGFTNTVNELKKLGGSLVLGGELEFFASDQVAIVLGAEYWWKNSSGSLDSSGTLAEVTYGVAESSRVKMSVLPILGTLRVNLPFKGLRAYLGGGAGYYLGQVVIEETWNWTEDAETVDSGTREIKSTGSAIIPHTNAGIDLNLTKNIALAVDIRYPFGAIKSFKIKRDTGDSSSVGQKFTFEVANGGEKDFKWELSGLNFGINLKIRF